MERTYYFKNYFNTCCEFDELQQIVLTVLLGRISAIFVALEIACASRCLKL